MKMAVRRFGKTLLASNRFQSIAATLLYGALVAVHKTNRFMPESDNLVQAVDGKTPVIIALWHGQQLMAPFLYPRNEDVAALVSKSADAEINARVLEKAGVMVIRGSGGRARTQTIEKGGIRALKGMLKALARGLNIVMIADISKGAPRQAGEGIVTLGKLSGRPIIPLAVATSRYHIVEKSWDKTTINLPFGRACLKLGNPIHIPRDASDAEVADFRQMLTNELNRVTEKAYQAVGARA